MGIDMGPDSGLRLAKPERRAKAKARLERKRVKGVHEVRMYVMGRERYRCRCCRLRTANSLHEIQFRSQGGKVSRRNSIAVCGDGVNGCHGFMQRHEVSVSIGLEGAEGDLKFTPHTQAAADWMRVKAGETVESPIMQYVESAE